MKKIMNPNKILLILSIIAFISWPFLFVNTGNIADLLPINRSDAYKHSVALKLTILAPPVIAMTLLTLSFFKKK